jgi:hypothetical protein
VKKTCEKRSKNLLFSVRKLCFTATDSAASMSPDISSSSSDCYGSLTQYLHLRKENNRGKWNRRVIAENPLLVLIFSTFAHHLDAINQQFWHAQVV